MSIVCTGSVAYDYLMSFPGYFREHILIDRLESISLSFLVDSMIKQQGGTAPNIAYTLALLGDRPKVMATVGIDFGEYRTWLESKGIDTSCTMTIPDTYTASFFANTDRDNNQISSFYPGAMAFASQLSLRDLGEKPDLVIISPNDPGAMIQYAAECHELGFPYLYDIGQQVVRISGEELRNGVKGAQSVFVNEYEFELLQKHTGMTPDEIVHSVGFLVVTLGAKGAAVYANGRIYAIPSVKPKEILDPTGVGDAFRGGFVRGQHLGQDYETCGRMGSLAAAYCLETRGPQEHSYTREEFIERYQENFGSCETLAALLNPKS